MKIGMPARILDKHVGGNTTYARALAKEYEGRGMSVGRFGIIDNPYLNVFAETFAGLRSETELDLLHYVADTGPVVRPRVPSVVTVHGIASKSVDSIRSPIKEKIWRMRVSRAIKSCDRVITVSNSSANDIIDVFRVPERRIRVIPHGLTTPISEPSEVSSEVKQAVADGPFVLYVGNLEPRKNLVSLIEAMSSPDLAELTLVIAGRPAWGYEPIMQAIQASESVKYLGFVSDDERQYLMQRCQIFAFPSLYEGFGFPVLEALAAGVPVICSDRGSLAEVAGPAQRFKGVDANSIAHGIASALQSIRWLEEIRSTGPAWADRYTWAASAEAHLRVYEEIA